MELNDKKTKFTYEMKNDTKDNKSFNNENDLNNYHLIKDEQNINYPSYENFIMSRFNNYNNINLNSKLFLSENSKNNLEEIKPLSFNFKNEYINKALSNTLSKDYYNNLNFISKNDKSIPYFHGLKISNKFNKNKRNFYNDLEHIIEYNNKNKKSNKLIEERITVKMKLHILIILLMKKDIYIKKIVILILLLIMKMIIIIILIVIFIHYIQIK